jgi:predicted DNA-binding transcriptional regulator YafY
VKRIDRLAALVEELRAVAPQPCTAAALAGRFGVSTRTIERDVLDLQRSGVPVWARSGPLGGYTLDAGEALPDIGFTLAEAAVVAQALGVPPTLPNARAARTAKAKLVAALSASAVEGAADLGARLALLATPAPVEGAGARIIEQAVLERARLRLSWVDPAGAGTDVEVGPLALAGGRPHWYLVAWCPSEARARTFRLDRISAVHPTGHLDEGGLPVAGERFSALVAAPERYEG